MWPVLRGTIMYFTLCTSEIWPVKKDGLLWEGSNKRVGSLERDNLYSTISVHHKSGLIRSVAFYGMGFTRGGQLNCNSFLLISTIRMNDMWGYVDLEGNFSFFCWYTGHCLTHIITRTADKCYTEATHYLIFYAVFADNLALIALMIWSGKCLFQK